MAVARGMVAGRGEFPTLTKVACEGDAATPDPGPKLVRGGKESETPELPERDAGHGSRRRQRRRGWDMDDKRRRRTMHQSDRLLILLLQDPSCSLSLERPLDSRSSTSNMAKCPFASRPPTMPTLGSKTSLRGPLKV